MNNPTDNAYGMSVPQIIHRVRGLSDLLRSSDLALLTEQMEQAGYELLARGDDSDGDGRRLALRRYVQVSRGCIREMGYQVLRAREDGLPDRRPLGPVYGEFLEVRRMLAGLIRGVRRQAKVRD